MPTSTIPAIQRRIAVNVSIDRAFHTFTASFSTWWPPTYHIGQAEMAEAILEPHAGGRWYERGTDGTECDWGRILIWEPPHRLLLTWQIDGQWQYDPDPAHASEIDVRFFAEGPDLTRIELEHRYLDRLAHAQDLADAVSADSGWNGILASFATATTPD